MKKKQQQKRNKKMLYLAKMHFKTKALTEWETCNREMLSILISADWFIAIFRVLVKKAMDYISLESVREEDYLSKGYQLLQSVGICIYDCDMSTVGSLADQAVVR